MGNLVVINFVRYLLKAKHGSCNEGRLDGHKMTARCKGNYRKRDMAAREQITHSLQAGCVWQAEKGQRSLKRQDQGQVSVGPSVNKRYESKNAMVDLETCDTDSGSVVVMVPGGKNGLVTAFEVVRGEGGATRCRCPIEA